MQRPSQPVRRTTYSFASAGPVRANSADASTSRVDARSGALPRSGSNGWDDGTAWATEDSDGESPSLPPAKQLSSLQLSTGPSLPSTSSAPSPASSGPRSPTRSTSSSLWDVLRGRTTSADPTPRSRPSPASSVAPLPSPMVIRPVRDGGGPAALAGSAGSSNASGQWILLPGDDADGPSRPPPLSRETMLEALRSDSADLVANPTEALRRLHVSDDGTFFRGLACPLPGDDAPVASTSKAPLPSPFQQSTPSRPHTPARPDVPGESAASASARREARRKDKLLHCLTQDNVDMATLRKLAWSGIPTELRPITWQLLLSYLPAVSARRKSVLARKRQEYADAVARAFERGTEGLDGPIWHQIHIDVPRTCPGVRLWQHDATRRSLERILYVWAIRHPASGYVQGINDLVTPFFEVFLQMYIDVDPEEYDVGVLPPAVLEAVEADAFWCLSKLVDGIQDNYISGQPGIRRQVARMQELCKRVDAPLAAHLAEQEVEFMQFAFRWYNCLLLREMRVHNIIRLWDTYLGTDAFSDFHMYVCLAFLVKWSDKLRTLDFQGIIMYLQSLPSATDWDEKATELLLAEAYVWKNTFSNTHHLATR